ncbi:hypothetical protein [Phenylobacterium sp.]|jgi:hypothetical protein|uniref:hypothetical protein n=1 Tax=Phenylobacterium sp. TaxID=1871053 RepID=UPI002F42D2DB
MTFDVDPPDPEPHRSRRGVIPSWLEWVTSLSALVVSISSIFIAVHNSHDADKALAAQTYPYIEVSRDDVAPDGVTRRLQLNLANQGVGPAHEESLTVRVGGHYATSLRDLIATAVGPAATPGPSETLDAVRNVQPTRFIPADKTQFLFSIPRTSENARWWDPFQESMSRWHITVCYCSVFNECWVRHDEDAPQPVKACHRDEPHEYN